MRPGSSQSGSIIIGVKSRQLFEYLKQNFDVILVDCAAPVGMVDNAMTLGKFANCPIMHPQGHPYKKQIVLIDEFYKEKEKLPKVSIIINDVKVKPGYGYYGYRGGYGYGYKSKYYEEEKNSGGNLFNRFFRII